LVQDSNPPNWMCHTINCFFQESFQNYLKEKNSLFFFISIREFVHHSFSEKKRNNKKNNNKKNF
jgi:hypothetical protein